MNTLTFLLFFQSFAISGTATRYSVKAVGDLDSDRKFKTVEENLSELFFGHASDNSTTGLFVLFSVQRREFTLLCFKDNGLKQKYFI